MDVTDVRTEFPVQIREGSGRTIENVYRMNALPQSCIVSHGIAPDSKATTSQIYKVSHLP